MPLVLCFMALSAYVGVPDPSRTCKEVDVRTFGLLASISGMIIACRAGYESSDLILEY